MVSCLATFARMRQLRVGLYTISNSVPLAVKSVVSVLPSSAMRPLAERLGGVPVMPQP